MGSARPGPIRPYQSAHQSIDEGAHVQPALPCVPASAALYCDRGHYNRVVGLDHSLLEEPVTKDAATTAGRISRSTSGGATEDAATTASALQSQWLPRWTRSTELAARDAHLMA